MIIIIIMIMIIIIIINIIINAAYIAYSLTYVVYEFQNLSNSRSTIIAWNKNCTLDIWTIGLCSCRLEEKTPVTSDTPWFSEEISQPPQAQSTGTLSREPREGALQQQLIVISILTLMVD